MECTFAEIIRQPEARSYSADFRQPDLFGILPFSPYTVMPFDKELDARGLNCPLPILRAKKALADMASGQVLRIFATDPGSVKDFQAFAKQTGNALLSHEEAEKVFTFFLKKK